MVKVACGGGLTGVAVAALLIGCSGATPGGESTASTTSAEHGDHGEHGEGATSLPNNLPFPNPSGYSATYSATGSVDLTGPFFQSLGANGRACVSCHQASDGWTVIPSHIQERFEETGGTDPIFRTNDGSNSPTADVSTVEARRAAYNMLLTKGLIRVGIGISPTAEFTLDAVDDPYGHASSSDLSLFRRPLPSTNLSFLTTVMWDGRETFGGADHCNAANEGGKCFASVHFDLADQSNGATQGHAQAPSPIDAATREAIVAFETSLFTAQIFDNHAHNLTAKHGRGGPENIASQISYYGINDNLGDYQTHAAFDPNVFTLYTAWEGSHGGGTSGARGAVARGEALFNTRAITISGVGGLNGANSPFSPSLPDSFVGACTTCHDTPNGGNHSIVAPLNIGLTDASRRTADMPLYTLRNKTTNATVQTTDPGRALISGKWNDIGKFKGPILRGLAARAPYFHNGSAATLDAAVDFYNDRFGMGLSDEEHDDLVAFLRTL